jgi:hypothetical protein
MIIMRRDDDLKTCREKIICSLQSDKMNQGKTEKQMTKAIELA